FSLSSTLSRLSLSKKKKFLPRKCFAEIFNLSIKNDSLTTFLPVLSSNS
ncbi:unnamed protein product, partial [Arabidopsis halleri]